MKFVVIDAEETAEYLVEADSKDEAILALMDKHGVDFINDNDFEVYDINTRIEQLNNEIDECKRMDDTGALPELVDEIRWLEKYAGKKIRINQLFRIGS